MQAETGLRQRFDSCMTKPGEKVMAWSPVLYTYCLWNAGSNGEKLALTRCNSALPAKIRKLAPCRIAYDKYEIVDPLFARGLTKIPSIPLSIKIYDDKIKSLQSAHGELVFIDSSDGNNSDFKIFADKVALCKGATIGPYDKKHLTYKMVCFGREFRGRAVKTKLLSVDGFLFHVPETLRIYHNKSYIDFKY